MTFDYDELEYELTQACDAVHKDFLGRFNNEMYVSVVGSKLEAFVNDLQTEFENTAMTFIKEYKLEKETESKKMVFNVTKIYAKKCVEDFNKV